MARLSSCAGRSGQVCSVDGTLVDALAGVLVPEGSTCNGHHWVMAPPNRLGSVLACRCLIAPSEGHGQGPDHRRWRRRASGRDGAAARRDRRGRPRGLRPHQPGEGRLLPHCGQQRHRRAARHRRRHLGHACRSRPWAPASRSPCRHRFGRTTSTARASAGMPMEDLPVALSGPAASVIGWPNPRPLAARPTCRLYDRPMPRSRPRHNQGPVRLPVLFVRTLRPSTSRSLSW
jgi:hypothetical protein